MADTTTVNFNLTKPAFDKPRYNQQLNANFDIIDSLLAKYIAVLNVRGVWQNSTIYAVGDHVVDQIDGQLYRVISAHTSPGLPTLFASYRSTNPGVWASATLGVRARGAWSPSTSYALGDFVVFNDIYAICTSVHNSSASPTGFSNDVARWSYLIAFETSQLIQRLTASGGTLNINWNNGNHVELTVTGSTTLTFSPRITTNRTECLRLTCIFTGNQIITPPASRWPNSGAPSIRQTFGGNRQEFIFTTSDAGASYDAFIAGMNMG